MAKGFSLSSILGGIGIARTKPSPTKEAGTSGFAAYGGVIDTGERHPKLIGSQRWLTVSDILANTSIVAAGTRYFLNLIAKSNWAVEPAIDQPDAKDPSSDAAKQAAEFLESAMYDMETSWTRMVRRSAMFRFHGFGIQEWTSKLRDDGRIGFENIASRPQHTITKWDLEPHGAVLGVVQQNPMTFEEIYLPRQKLVYLVDDTLTDSPEGMGLFRHVVDPAERLAKYLQQEGFGFERDLRGIPIGRAPLSQIDDLYKSNQITLEEKERMLGVMRSFVSQQVKQKNSGLLIDSATYAGQTAEGETPSSVYKWAVELLTGGVSGLGDVNEAVNRLNREIARILGAEHLMLGEGAGSRSLADDKSGNMFMQVEATLGDLAEGYERDFVGPIWTMNGLDDRLRPTLKFEAVQFRDIVKISAMLRDMATAGVTLSPDDPAVNDLRDLAGISQVPEEIRDRQAEEMVLAREAEQAMAQAALNPAPQNQTTTAAPRSRANPNTKE